MAELNGTEKPTLGYQPNKLTSASFDYWAAGVASVDRTVDIERICRSRARNNSFVNKQVVNAVGKTGEQRRQPTRCRRVSFGLKYLAALRERALQAQQRKVELVLGGLSDQLGGDSSTRFSDDLDWTAVCEVRRDNVAVCSHDRCMPEAKAATRASATLDPKRCVGKYLVHGYSQEVQRRVNRATAGGRLGRAADDEPRRSHGQAGRPLALRLNDQLGPTGSDHLEVVEVDVPCLCSVPLLPE